MPTDDIDPRQTKLAFGWGDSSGGYKVPALIGLYWTAPYLHDGGIAVDPGLKMVNVAGTGHEFWVDSPRNFTAEDQRALIGYLLTATPDDDFGVPEPGGHPRTARAK